MVLWLIDNGKSCYASIEPCNGPYRYEYKIFHCSFILNNEDLRIFIDLLKKNKWNEIVDKFNIIPDLKTDDISVEININFVKIFGRSV